LLDPDLAEHVKTNLEHGRHRVDFKLLQADEDRNGDIARIESLDLWRIPVVACTVDTVLGVVQNNRRGLFGWPALAQGGFVFDEIHSYDDKLFDALLHFLNAVRGPPVLLMTASLPEHRRKAIEQALSERGETLVQIDGPADLERRPRYRWLEAKPDEVVRAIEQQLERCGKVLRVCNTVRAAIIEARALEDAGLSPIVYHSRFKYIDRDEAGREHAASSSTSALSAPSSRTVRHLRCAPRLQRCRWTYRPRCW
jgi:CRISPR-associated endonuclease/helicase Cas3